MAGKGKRIYRVGFVGYCSLNYDENLASQYIKEAFDKIESQHPNDQIEFVSGATNVGTLRQAYEEAHKRGWKLTGIACKKAKDYPLYPHLSRKIIKGDQWGDESPEFLKYIRHGTMIKVGGGKQSEREYAAMKRMSNEVIEYELPQNAEKKGLEKLCGFFSIISIISGVISFAPTLTGNVIRNSGDNFKFGAVFLLIGFILGLFYFKLRKK